MQTRGSADKRFQTERSASKRLHTEGSASDEALSRLSRSELLEYVQMCSKNLFAIDGTWFQALESEMGMDAAMHYDASAWDRFTVSEAQRLKRFLRLEDDCGLEGLARALPLKLTSPCNETEIVWDGDDLLFRVVSCRVQTARARKGMEFHPCKPVGLIEYGGFARTLDSRIECTCESCYPDVSDATCACAWRFSCRSALV